MNNMPLKILIVEDEEGLANAMVGLLKMKGLEAFYTIDGPEAVKIFEERRPEICVIDIQLGYSKLNGLQVLEKVKQVDVSTECIIVTRITDEESIEKARKLGAAHYLLKPLDSQEWRDVVLEAAQRVREGRQSSGQSAS